MICPGIFARVPRPINFPMLRDCLEAGVKMLNIRCRKSHCFGPAVTVWKHSKPELCNALTASTCVYKPAQAITHRFTARLEFGLQDMKCMRTHPHHCAVALPAFRHKLGCRDGMLLVIMIRSFGERWSLLERVMLCEQCCEQS